MRTLKNELVEKGISQTATQEIKEEKTNTNRKSKETLSQREWKEIMGFNRDTFSRGKGGAIRRR